MPDFGEKIIVPERPKTILKTQIIDEPNTPDQEYTSNDSSGIDYLRSKLWCRLPKRVVITISSILVAVILFAVVLILTRRKDVRIFECTTPPVLSDEIDFNFQDSACAFPELVLDSSYELAEIRYK